MDPLRAFLLACLLALPATSQNVTATNMGGGCGGTTGYPTWGTGTRLYFYLQRPMCPTSGWAWPTGLFLDLQPPQFALPFLPGLAPGCVVIAPSFFLWSGSVGGAGTAVFVVDLAQVPLPITVYLQGVANCAGGSFPADIAFSDAWRLQIR